MLLALDLSLTAGVAWGCKGTRPRSLVWNLPEREHNLNRALVSLREQVMAMCKFEKVQTVVIEASMRTINREHSAYSAFCLTSLQAVAREAGQRSGARVEMADVQTWRKHFIGSGNLPSAQAKAAVMIRCGQLGYPFTDDNSAEALGIWDWGIATFHSRAGALVL